jgi:hypothetical protein
LSFPGGLLRIPGHQKPVPRNVSSLIGSLEVIKWSNVNFRQAVHDDRNPQSKTYKYLFTLSVMPAVFSGHPVGDFESLDFADDILLTTPLGRWNENDPGME